MGNHSFADQPFNLRFINKNLDTVECLGHYGVAREWDIPCADLLTTQGYDSLVPSHAHATVTYIESGAPMMRVGGRLDGKSAGPGRGQLLMYSGGYDRRWKVAGGSRYRQFYVNQSLVEACAREIGSNHPVELRDTSVFVNDVELWEMLNGYFARSMSLVDPPTRMEMDSRAALICLRLVNTQSNLSRRATPKLHPLAGRRLMQVLELIEANLDDSLRIADLAKSVDLGVRQFTKIFREATGLAPHQYVMQRRLEKAKLLLSTELPAADIALACGFSSQQHFGTAFRKFVGVSPCQWRLKQG